MNRTFAILIAALVGIAAGGVAFVWSGVYNIAASSPHTQAVYSLLEQTMQQSVRLRARSVEPPALDTPGLFERGAACYQHRCELCHGGPSVAQSDIALGMQPLPGPLVDANLRWKPREVYWITRNGITMSGMPAWKLQLVDGDIWAIVAFLQRLPQLSPADYRELMASRQGERCGIDEASPAADVAGDAKRGRSVLPQYGCNGCHRIPGITGADVHVGPPLAGIARRQLIAGQIANTPEAMVRWIRAPQSIDPRTAMPNLSVTEADARDIAAYLATLW
jgi:mono/diheme cytochrome c family protein